MKSTSLSIQTAVAALVVVLFGGCGGVSADQGDSAGSEAFIEILQGLKSAAASGTTYPALRKAKSLDDAERAVVEEFCNNVRQIRYNHEAHVARNNRSYVVERLVRYGAYWSDEDFTAEVRATVEQLGDVIDLGSFDAEKLKRYEDACYG
jgi:hypothetical protein